MKIKTIVQIRGTETTIYHELPKHWDNLTTYGKEQYLWEVEFNLRNDEMEMNSFVVEEEDV